MASHHVFLLAAAYSVMASKEGDWHRAMCLDSDTVTRSFTLVSLPPLLREKLQRSTKNRYLQLEKDLLLFNTNQNIKDDACATVSNSSQNFISEQDQAFKLLVSCEKALTVIKQTSSTELSEQLVTLQKSLTNLACALLRYSKYLNSSLTSFLPPLSSSHVTENSASDSSVNRIQLARQLSCLVSGTQMLIATWPQYGVAGTILAIDDVILLAIVFALLVLIVISVVLFYRRYCGRHTFYTEANVEFNRCAAENDDVGRSTVLDEGVFMLRNPVTTLTIDDNVCC